MDIIINGIPDKNKVQRDKTHSITPVAYKDISAAAADIAERCERYEKIIATLPSGVVVCEIINGACFLIYASERACDMLGYTQKECDLMIEKRIPIALPAELVLCKTGQIPLGRRLTVSRCTAERKDKSKFPVRMDYSAERGRGNAVICYAALTDLTVEMDFGKQIDGVTGIRARDSAKPAIERALAERPSGRCDAMLFIDVDNFKEINDTHGHCEGDCVLRSVAMSIKRSFRETDIVARFGGDEFMVYMRGAGTREFAEEKASRIAALVSEIDCSGIKVSCSIGVTCIKGSDYSFEDAFRRADSAMYTAKKSGRNRICYRDK